nr:antibiotic biosynthesis monooxygenase family protein [uncultured Desulfobacter sp.]
MIIVRMTLNVHPEKHLEVLQTLLSLIDPLAKEPGCRSCCAVCDIDDENRFTLLEEWETQKEMDNHIRSHRFGVLLGTKNLLSEPLRIRIHTVSQTWGMDAVQALRRKKDRWHIGGPK